MGGSTANYFGLSGDLAVKYRFLLFFLGSMEIDGLYMLVPDLTMLLASEHFQLQLLLFDFLIFCTCRIPRKICKKYDPMHNVLLFGVIHRYIRNVILVFL